MIKSTTCSLFHDKLWQDSSALPDINQREKEGERWKATATDGINSNDKSYYCVKGSR